MRATDVDPAGPAPAPLARREKVGGYAWARRGGGRLAAGDRLRLLGQGLAFQLRELPLMLGGPLGLRPRRVVHFDLADLRIPDTAVAREAQELCERMRPRTLVDHSYRTYAWAAAVAAHRGLAYDPEVVYVGALLHDLGLAESHRREDDRCFTLIGAEAAEHTGRRGGWSKARAELAAEAITLHMNLRVPPAATEAWLVTLGTQLDAVGAGYWTVAAGTREAVVRRWPRGETKRDMVALFDWQARHNAGTRAQFYARWLNLRWRLRHTPFES